VADDAGNKERVGRRGITRYNALSGENGLTAATFRERQLHQTRISGLAVQR